MYFGTPRPLPVSPGGAAQGFFTPCVASGMLDVGTRLDWSGTFSSPRISRLQRYAMHCNEFRERHLAFVDGTMSDADMVAMQRHLGECEECSRHDTALRRGLLVFRNLAPVQPSADFATRLHARLRMLSHPDQRAELFRAPGIGAFMAAASVVALGFAAASMLQWTEVRRDLMLEPVIASSPAVPAPIVDYPFVAASSTGMPMWSAAVLVEQASMHFVNAEAHFATLSR